MRPVCIKRLEQGLAHCYSWKTILPVNKIEKVARARKSQTEGPERKFVTTLPLLSVCTDMSWS